MSSPLNVLPLMVSMGKLSSYVFLCFAQRVLAAFAATSRRSDAVMVSRRRLPPILPPRLPIADMTRDISDFDGFGSGWLSVERRTIWNAA
jgi:hypothetical protein